MIITCLWSINRRNVTKTFYKLHKNRSKFSKKKSLNGMSIGSFIFIQIVIKICVGNFAPPCSFLHFSRILSFGWLTPD